MVCVTKLCARVACAKVPKVPRLLRKTKVDVAKCHACHAKRRLAVTKCHSCHTKMCVEDGV